MVVADAPHQLVGGAYDLLGVVVAFLYHVRL